MRTILLSAIFFLSGALIAQTKVSVTVSSNQFNPSSVNINVGDTVEWTNVQGNHNVNGTQTTFPSNPQSFGNSVGMGWTYSHVFTAAGSYSYRCDPHASLGMTGTVTVQNPAGVSESQSSNLEVLYNPTQSSISITGLANIDFVNVFDANGKLVTERKNISGDTFITLSNQATGIYFVKVGFDGTVVSKKIIKP